MVGCQGSPVAAPRARKCLFILGQWGRLPGAPMSSDDQSELFSEPDAAMPEAAPGAAGRPWRYG